MFSKKALTARISVLRIFITLLLAALAPGALLASGFHASPIASAARSRAYAAATRTAAPRLPAPIGHPVRSKRPRRPGSRPTSGGPVSTSDIAYTTPQYTLQDLGTVLYSNSGPAGVNDAGNVLTNGENSKFENRGYVYTPANGFQDIGTLQPDDSQNENFSWGGYFLPYAAANLSGYSYGSVYPSLSTAINSTTEITGYDENYNFGSGGGGGTIAALRALALPVNANHAILWTPASGMVDLGTLTSSPSGDSYGVAINNYGQVVGESSSDSVGNGEAFLWVPDSANGTTGAMIGLGVIGDSGLLSGGYSLGSYAYGINDNAEVVGVSDAGNQLRHAFLWTPDGKMYDLGTLVGSNATSQAIGIGSDGDVFGVSSTAKTDTYDTVGGHAFLWTPDTANGTTGSMVDIGTLSTFYDYGSTPTGIDDDDEVIGQASVDGINPVTQSPPIQNPNYPYGESYVPYGHAFIYASPTMYDMGALYCGAGPYESPYNTANYSFYSWATAVNGSGTVVGSSNMGVLQNYSTDYRTTATHAFVYTYTPDGFMYDLNDLLIGSNITGWTLNTADSINASGQIAGTGIGPDGATHFYLLTPADSTATVPTPIVTPDYVANGGVYESSLFPQNNQAGNPDFQLAINGSHFAADAQVTFNGDTLSNVWVQSDSLILATVPQSEIANVGNYPVVVTNPGNETPSATMSFTVVPQVKTPTLTSLSPNTAVAGGPAFEMTIQGTNFDSTTRVSFAYSDESLTPDSVSADGTSLTVAIPANDIYSPPSATTGAYTFKQGATLAVTATNYPNSTDSYASNEYGVTSNALPFTVTNPAPTITSISPPEIAVGTSGEYVIINGTGFNQSSVVTWSNPNDGTSVTTPSYSDDNGTQIGIYIRTQDTTSAAVVPVTVTNPAVLTDGSDGGSASSSFTIGNPTPTITTMYPTAVQAGGASFTMYLTGTNFAPGTTVQFGSDSAIIPSYIDTTGADLKVTIPAADIASPNTVNVTVTSPYGGISNVETFNIDNPQPYITALSPFSRVKGLGDFTLTITGGNFEPGATVSFGSTGNLTAAITNANTLTVSISGSLVAAAGTYPVVVTNPNPHNDSGSFSSLPVNFIVTPDSQTLVFSTAQNPLPATDTATAPLNQGWYSEAVSLDPNQPTFGYHDGQNADYIVGQTSSVGTGQPGSYSYTEDFHNYFIFNLSTLDLTGEKVASATLQLQVYSYQSDSGQTKLTYGLWSVSTPPNILQQTINSLDGASQKTIENGIFDNLANGSSYGTFSVPLAATGTTISLPLSGSALSDLAAHAGQSGNSAYFAIGGALQNLPSTGNEYIFAGSSYATGGGTPQYLILSLEPTNPNVVGVALNPTSVTGGGSSTGTVTLSGPAPAGGAAVDVSSDNSAATPTSATVAAGQTTGTFTVATSSVTSKTTANITAAYNNTSASAPLTITPPLPTVTGLTLNPASVTGGQSSTATVTLSGPAPDGGAAVTVSSDNAAALSGSLTVPAGQQSGTVNIATTAVTVLTTANLIASYNNSTASASLTVASADTKSPPILLAAAPANGSANLTWAPAPISGLTYALYRGASLNGQDSAAVASGLTGTAYTDSGVVNGTTYYYFLRSTDGVQSNQVSATPINPASPTPPSALQIAISTVKSWTGNTSQFTATLTNIGGAPQYLSNAEITAQTAVGTGWAALDSKLSTQPLLPNASIQVTFDLNVPNTATGGTADNPTVVPLALVVDGNAVYQRNFDLDLYQQPPTALKVSVVDDKGNPLPDSELAFDNDAKVYGTDENGEVTLPEAPGSITVYAYCKGFLPAQQNVEIANGTTKEITISLQPGDPLSVVSFTVTPISGVQAAAYGIDLDDPDNYDAYEFTLQIGVETTKAAGVFPHSSNTGGYGGGGGGGWGNLWGAGGTVIGKVLQPKNDQFIIVWLGIPGKVHFLKQFFTAAALITNDTPYTIGDVSADIDVPDGLELPDLAGEKQDETQHLGDIKAGQTGKAEWVVRGDDPGDYTIGGRTDGSLKLGGASIPVASDLEGDVTVEKPELDVDFTKPSSVTKGTPFTLGINVTNKSTIDLEDASIDLEASDLVNCYLPSSQDEKQDLGTIPAGGTVHVDYQIIPEVSGDVKGVDHYPTDDPDTMPQVDIRAFLLEAKDESVSTPANTPIDIDALKDAIAVAIGEDLGTLEYDGVSAAKNGTSSIDTSKDVLHYAPGQDYIGLDSFGYSISDSKGDVASASVLVTINTPTLGSLGLSPNSAAVNSGDTNLTINGSGFYSGTTVSFNGVPLSGFTVNSSTQISAVVPASLLTAAGPVPVVVSNGSNSAYGSFNITGNPVPYETNISPNTAPAGAADQSITVTGIGFVSGSTVQWNGAAIPTTFLNSGALRADVPASDLSAPGTANVAVSSPSPGGGVSSPLPFTVTPTSPIIKVTVSSLASSAGGLTASLTVTNTGTGPAANLTLANAAIIYLSSGKLVTVNASSLAQPVSSTLGIGSSTGESATFPGLPSGTKVGIKVTESYGNASASPIISATVP